MQEERTLLQMWGKYPLHQCPNKQLKVMLLEDDEAMDDNGDFPKGQLSDLRDSDCECSMLLGNLIYDHHDSLQQDSPQTMKL